MRGLDAIVRAKCVRAGLFRPVAPTHVRPHFQKHFSEKSGMFFLKKIQGSICLNFLFPALSCKIGFFLLDMWIVKNFVFVCQFIEFIKGL